MSEAEIRQLLRSYIVDVALSGDARGFDDDTDLLAGGILDSFGIVQFVMYIEEEIGELPREQISRETFRSVSSAAARIVANLARERDEGARDERDREARSRPTAGKEPSPGAGG